MRLYYYLLLFDGERCLGMVVGGSVFLHLIVGRELEYSFKLIGVYVGLENSYVDESVPKCSQLVSRVVFQFCLLLGRASWFARGFREANTQVDALAKGGVDYVSWFLMVDLLAFGFLVVEACMVRSFGA
ncbi:hypothetical protein V6N13_108652 [Hibiscus sabdariffa]